MTSGPKRQVVSAGPTQALRRQPTLSSLLPTVVPVRVTLNGLAAGVGMTAGVTQLSPGSFAVGVGVAVRVGVRVRVGVAVSPTITDRFLAWIGVGVGEGAREAVDERFGRRANGKR